jgi:hypothetical protein
MKIFELGTQTSRNSFSRKGGHSVKSERLKQPSSPVNLRRASIHKYRESKQKRLGPCLLQTPTSSVTRSCRRSVLETNLGESAALDLSFNS